MTTEDFSAQFDVLVNSFALSSPNGIMLNPSDLQFDEYEKSVFLTKAQKALIIGLYNGRGVNGQSFEQTEENRRYLQSLIQTYKPTKVTEYTDNHTTVGETSQVYELPQDLYFITYEQVTFEDDVDDECLRGKTALVTPVTQDTFYKINRNPFRGPNERKVLRLDFGNGQVELVSRYNIKEYLIRYLAKPSPIILIELDEDEPLEIDGVKGKNNTPCTCKLGESLHHAILELAVKMAIQSKSTHTNKAQ